MWGHEKWLVLLKFEDYLSLLIALHWFIGLWKIYLFARQLSVVRRTIAVPPEFVGKINPQVHNAKRKIAMSGYTFSIFMMTFMLVVKTLKLALGFHVFLWELTAAYSETLEHRASWYAAFDEAVNDLTLLPVHVSAYMLFKKKSVSVVAVFLAMAIQILFSAISAAQSMMFLVWLTESFGASALFYTPLALNLIGLVFVAVYIHSFAPENMQKLLASTNDGELKCRLVAITRSVRFPVDRIFVDRSIPGANAYFLGVFGANMIAVSPELLAIMNGREVAACVAHELGHWSHHHNDVLLMFALASVLSTSFGWFYAYDNSLVNQNFRFKAPQAVVPVTLWITYVSTLSSDLIAGVTSLVGCACEYTADAFAAPQGLAAALVDGLIALTVHSRWFAFFDKWYSAWFNHHPTVFQRIKRLNKIN